MTRFASRLLSPLRQVAGVAVGLALGGCLGGSGVEGVAGLPDDARPDLEEPAPRLAEPVPAEVSLPGVTAPASPGLSPLPGGASDGDGLLVHPDDLTGVFVYGMGSDPGGVFAAFGATGAGISPFRVSVELADATITIRVIDPDSGLAIPGPNGVVQSYPYTTETDGRVRVDFAAPITPPTIHLFGSCRYELASYDLVAPPVYADGLLTWPTDERYERDGCGSWVPRTAGGLHVHYLRHAEAGRAYTSRPRDPDSPFGFFLADPGGAGAPLLTRLSGVDPAEGHGEPTDGDVVYYLAPGFPEAFVGAAHAVFEGWNDALEEVTGRRPFAVERAPAGMIAWDPRFHVVLWDDTQGSGAIAPFAEDPATGEIFQAFVVMWFGELDRLVERYTGFFEEHPEVADRLTPVPETRAQPPLPAFGAEGEDADVPARRLRVRAYPRRDLTGEVVRRTMSQLRADLGRDLSPQEVADLIVRDFLVHEVGHNLGLRHNFLGLTDLTHAHDGDTSSTTMDYVVGLVVPGRYDLEAMRYAYGDGTYAPGFAYCTDEHTEVDPGCAQWDFGHPVVHFLDVLDDLIAAHPPGTSSQAISDAARADEWSALFRRVRQFLNTDYELWDPALPASVFEALLDQVMCEGECDVHRWFRTEAALYLMYTRHVLTAYWEPGAPDVWWDFPALDATQAARLMSSFETLIKDRSQDLTLKRAIVGKLPTANVPGAAALLESLEAYLEDLAEPNGDEAQLLADVRAALGG